MEKKEVQRLFKEYMKEQGFSVKGNRCFKHVDDQYIIGIWLDHSSFGKVYRIVYGVIYLPTEEDKQFPFANSCDWSSRFYFTKDPSDDLAKYPVELLDTARISDVTFQCSYENRTKEEFLASFTLNMERRFSHIYNKEYVLNQYRTDWHLFRKLRAETIPKICTLANIDHDAVIAFLKN